MKYFCIILTLLSIQFTGNSQDHSVAHEWSENLLEAIRNDFARPTVHARNLYHCSMAMYDIWSIYDTSGVSDRVFLGKTLHGIECPMDEFPLEGDIETLRHTAISFAMYRIMSHRFLDSPGETVIFNLINDWMLANDYDINIISTDYSTGSPEALGNYVAACIIQYGLSDFSNEENDYGNQHYSPQNPPMVMAFEGNPDITDMNSWQPLTLDVFIDQSGNEVPFNTPPFLSPEWGQVLPFALSGEDLNVFEKDGNEYWVYHDPGPPPYIDVNDPTGMSEEYKWGFTLVSKWSSHLDKNDPTIWDISPASIGNIQSYPQSIEELRNFYDDSNGGDPSTGRDINPKTGEPYTPQMVPRGDYGRILAEFWADGPDSETPPGHWFAILNEIKDHPGYDKRFTGQGEVLGALEYDVKAYLTLAGAMHDSAISAWGIKGYYDYIRPVSSLRAMAKFGQSSDPLLPSYHPAGLPLEEGYVELVEAGDPLAGDMDEHVGKIKLFAWRGPDYINNPSVDEAGVDWILAENWWPYQRPSFVTPNFAGYVSGHSTFSRAAAEVLTRLTGDEYFPGGMGVFSAPRNDFLVFEQGPSMDIELQWATYRDASDQCSLSRIWGGIHPPADDIPGRLIGIEVGNDAFEYAQEIFYNDADQDGYYSFVDCDDNRPDINPAAVEICDGIDNNCDGQIDEGLVYYMYYADMDGDGFGDPDQSIEICDEMAPEGFVDNEMDCNDDEFEINPDREELCDGIDNDCNGIVDDGLMQFRYYYDADGDSFGDATVFLDTCLLNPPADYVANDLDCNDDEALINPDAEEICDAIDNNCNGIADEGLQKFRYYLDADMDGYGNSAVFADTCLVIPPVGYVTNDLDCNDDEAMINPDAEEICDAIDNDCNGIADDGLEKFRYYRDSDMDGYGNSAVFVDTCMIIPPTGYVSNDLDCNDDEAAINPDAEEVCDAIDNDCNGFADDGLEKFRYYLDSDIDGYGNSAVFADTCIMIPPVGYVVNDLDCDDTEAAINPDAEEICDAIDNDCNGFADDGLEKFRYFLDMDGDGFGDMAMSIDTCILVPPSGYVSNDTDCNDGDASIHPDAEELCDAIDNDCNGMADDGLEKIRYFLDFDGDGYGDQHMPVDTCIDTAPTGYVSDNSDCDDQSAQINPGETDISDNGVDEDCSGFDYYAESKVFPMPIIDMATIHYEIQGNVRLIVNAISGTTVMDEEILFVHNSSFVYLGSLPAGVYIMRLLDENEETLFMEKCYKN